MNTYISAVLWLAAGYLFGSLPTGYVVVKTMTGQDIRTVGSGNIVDMLKGGAAVMLCRTLAGGDLSVAAAALGAVLGHNYPVWLRFHGGKGVATTFGTLFFVQMWYSCAAVLLAGILWFLVMKAFRYVSLASLVALLATGAWFAFFGMHPAFIVLAGVLAVLSLWRHRSNVDRLIHGTENKVGRK